jgi:hypothetical protein
MLVSRYNNHIKYFKKRWREAHRSFFFYRSTDASGDRFELTDSLKGLSGRELFQRTVSQDEFRKADSRRFLPYISNIPTGIQDADKKKRKVGKCHRKHLIKAPIISYNLICSAIEYTNRSDESQHRIFWKITSLKSGFTGRIKTRHDLESETGKMQDGKQDGTVLFRIIASIR